MIFVDVKNCLKVVDCINKAPADLRPSVLVSATAVGYYGRSKLTNGYYLTL